MDGKTIEERVASLESDLTLLARGMVHLFEVLGIQPSENKYQETKTFAQLAAIAPNTKVTTLKGDVNIADIPMADDGYPTEEWALEYCPCERHTALRVINKKPPLTGQFL